MRSLIEHPDSVDSLIAEHVALPPTRPDGRALIRLNMISSADGGTAIAGKSSGLGNRNDHTVFAALRAQSDAVLVGMHTVVADHYGPPSDPGLQIYVITGKPDVSGNERLFASGRATLVLPDDAPPAPEGVPEMRAGAGGRVDLAAVASQLTGSLVLMEGGPRLAGEMVALGLIDQYFHTISPMVIAGDSARAIHGPPADATPWALAHGFCDDDGYLFLRYERG